MYILVADEFECRYEKIVVHVLEVQLCLITISAVQWKLVKLSAGCLEHCFELRGDIDFLFDCEVVFKIIVDYARRDFAFNLLKSDVVLQCRLKCLKHTWLSDLKSTQIDFREV